MMAASVILRKLPTANNRPMGENSFNLVTLFGIARKFGMQCSANPLNFA
jgi:hypothetical protein